MIKVDVCCEAFAGAIFWREMMRAGATTPRLS